MTLVSRNNNCKEDKMNIKVNSMVNNLKQMISDRNMERLKKQLYEFMHLNCGFIAHYNLGGFKHEYYDGEDFVGFLEDLKDGCEVWTCDEEDNYNYGYTNKEVKEALRELLTDEVIGKIQAEVTHKQKVERYEEYQRLKAEFGG